MCKDCLMWKRNHPATESGTAVREVELNPVLARRPGQGAVVLDALWIEEDK